MTLTWVTWAAVSTVGLGIAVQQTLSKPMPTAVKATASAFSSGAAYNKGWTDKAIVFATVAKGGSAFSGNAAWPALAASASYPGTVSSSSAMPATWYAQWNAGVLTVCMPGLPNVSLANVTTKISGVTAKNSGC